MDASERTKIWFNENVYFWRFAICTVWVAVLQAILWLVVLLLSDIDLFHPYQWLYDGMLTAVSVGSFAVSFFLAGLGVLLTYMYSIRYTVVPVVFPTALETIWNILLMPSKFLIITIYSLIGGLLVHIYLTPAGHDFSSLSATCTDDSSKQCLNDSHFICVLHGVFTGFLYSIGNESGGNLNYIKFPVIRQRILIEIKSGVGPKLRESFRRVISCVKWFIVAYALIGLGFRSWAADLVNLKLTSESSFSFILDVRLWYMMLLTGTAVCFAFHEIAYLFRIHQTQQFCFPVESLYEKQKHEMLECAIGCASLPLLQYLGFLDLSLLSQHSEARRKDIFSISQPGGHPYRWNSISTECLKQLNGVTERITKGLEPPVTASAHVLYSETGPVPPMGYKYQMWREKSLFPVSPTFLTQGVDVASPVAFHSTGAINGFQKTLTEKLLTAWASLKEIVTLEWLRKEASDLKVRRIFAESQLHIWAVEALGFLVAASFTEDKYGVVQKDLDKILRTLLNLQQAVNATQKIDASTTKRNKTFGCLPIDVALKHSLKCHLKLALYRITTRFQESLSVLELTLDQQKHLNKYLEFQE